MYSYLQMHTVAVKRQNGFIAAGGSYLTLHFILKKTILSKVEVKVIKKNIYIHLL